LKNMRSRPSRSPSFEFSHYREHLGVAAGEPKLDAFAAQSLLGPGAGQYRDRGRGADAQGARAAEERVA
jgi:hypothetical protein